MNAIADRLTAARSALTAVAGRTEQLLTSLPGTTVAVPGSDWNAGDVAAHLIIGLRAFTDAARGLENRFTAEVPGDATFHERLATINAQTIGEEPSRDLPALAELVSAGTRAFLDATDGRGPDALVPAPWYGDGAALSVGAATCMLLGEQLVHGYDLALGVGTHWPMTAEDAHLVLYGVQSMLPLVADPAAVAGLTARFHVRLRGGDRFAVDVTDGKVRVGPVAGRADCSLAADPVAFLLVGYGRMPQWRAIRVGKLMTWGRRPWLGLRFKGLFSNP